MTAPGDPRSQRPDNRGPDNRGPDNRGPDNRGIGERSTRPVSTLDEQVLSQRLHEDLDALAAPPAPVGPVLHRGRSIRARRWAAAASGLMAGAAAVAIVVSGQT